jgi:hypothetical protein
MVGQEHMPGLQRHQHTPFNVGGQNVPRTRQVSFDMGPISPRTQSFAAYPPTGRPMAIPEEYTFQQTPIQPLHIPSTVRRHTIDHPNQVHVSPPCHSVTFARQPEFIYDSEDSFDEEVFPRFRPRHDSIPVPRYVPTPGPLSSNPMPMVANTPIVTTRNPIASMQGNPMGVAGRRQGSLSMPPNHFQVNPQQVQVPMDIPTRPYSYLTSYLPGTRYTRYPTMVNDLEILANVLNPKNNLKQFVDVLARRSPYELDALRYEFSVMTGGQDLQLTFNSLVTNEDESIKSVISGLTLGPIAFDIWLLDGVLLPTSSMTDD